MMSFIEISCSSRGHCQLTMCSRLVGSKLMAPTGEPAIDDVSEPEPESIRVPCRDVPGPPSPARSRTDRLNSARSVACLSSWSMSTEGVLCVLDRSLFVRLRAVPYEGRETHR